MDIKDAFSLYAKFMRFTVVTILLIQSDNTQVYLLAHGVFLRRKEKQNKEKRRVLS